jgi:hypothetical protein
VHSSGTVVATCSGQRAIPDFEDSDVSSGDSESSEDETDEEDGDTNSYENSDGNESSTYSVKPTGRTPDNSIKVWSI